MNQTPPSTQGLSAPQPWYYSKPVNYTVLTGGALVLILGILALTGALYPDSFLAPLGTTFGQIGYSATIAAGGLVFLVGLALLYCASRRSRNNHPSYQPRTGTQGGDYGPKPPQGRQRVPQNQQTYAMTPSYLAPQQGDPSRGQYTYYYPNSGIPQDHYSMYASGDSTHHGQRQPPAPSQNGTGYGSTQPLAWGPPVGYPPLPHGQTGFPANTDRFKPDWLS